MADIKRRGIVTDEMIVSQMLADKPFKIDVLKIPDWEKEARKAFNGKTIVAVGYMSTEDAQEMGWSGRPCVFHLDDGTRFFALSDEEGNQAGVIHTNLAHLPVIPAIED